MAHTDLGRINEADISVDSGYGGRLVSWVVERFKFCLEMVLRPKETRTFV
ncbi:hypothetical protein [Nitrosomonas communis]|nr:hypothetical protein [Nitrosomonas communis]